VFALFQAGVSVLEGSLAGLDAEMTSTGCTIELPMLQYEQSKDLVLQMRVPEALRSATHGLVNHVAAPSPRVFVLGTLVRKSGEACR
jgi:hypothetical protein